MSPFFFLLILLTGQQVRPVPRPEAAAARGSIEGRVIRAGAAGAAAPEGLAEVQLELLPGNAMVMSRGDGGFTIRNLAPGKYTIVPTREGYVVQQDPARGITASGVRVTLKSGETLRNVVVPLTPAPVITGRIFDPHGQPLAAALVRAYRRLYTPFGTQLKIMRKGMTNDMGEFRLFGLSEGEYFVSAAFSDRERAAALGRTQLSANVSRADDGYVSMFYDGVDEITRARAIEISPGVDAGGIAINLADSQRFRIRGQVLPLQPGTRIALAPKGGDLSEADFYTQPNASGAFEVGGLFPGSYLLIASTNDQLWSSDVVTVNLNSGDSDGVRMVMEPTVRIAGTLAFESGQQRLDSPTLHVKAIRSTIEFDQQIDAQVRPDGSFTLEHVPPSAEWDMVVEPLRSGTYVKSITLAGRSILGGRARFQASPLRITLAEAVESLDVHVEKGGEPAVGAQVVLIPELLLRRRADRYVVGFTGESGDVTLTGIPPGRYTAYAFEKLKAGAYYLLAYNPSADNAFRDRAAAVIVEQTTANSRDPNVKPIVLRVVTVAETSGFE